MLDKLDAALRFQQEALNLRAQRQEILAANIANADTPGYQARDLDFASELKKVMVRGREETGGVSLTLTSAQHIPAQTVSSPSTELLYRIPDQPSLDGNHGGYGPGAHAICRQQPQVSNGADRAGWTNQRHDERAARRELIRGAVKYF